MSSTTPPTKQSPDGRTADSSLFEIHGVKLELPSELLTPRIAQAIASGKYEHLEARQLPRFLRDGDRLLEFGAGLGFISALSAKTVQLASCTVVEANPYLIPVIRNNHEINNVSSEIIHSVSLSATSALRADLDHSGGLPFYIAENFWGSSLTKSASSRRTERVQAISTSELIDRTQPTVIICDIEGGEIDIFDDCDLRSVRHIFFEVHKSIIGLEGIYKISQNLSKEKLYYDPDFSVGATVMFSKA